MADKKLSPDKKYTAAAAIEKGGQSLPDTPDNREGVVEKNKELQARQADEQRELRDARENLDMDDASAGIARHVAGTMKSDTQEEKIKKLLLVARQKGVVWAVNVAKKMDDPYMLDMFHDALAKEGFYKKFKQ